MAATTGGTAGGAQERWGRRLVVAVPYVWLLVFFLVPLVFVLKISVSESIIAKPPYTPFLTWPEEGGLPDVQASGINYEFLTTDRLYAVAYLNSLKIAAIGTLLTLLFAYPMAYGIARAKPTTRNVLLLFIVLPFWTSFLLRVYAWIGLLKNNGLINNALLWVGVIDEPLPLLNSTFAVYLGLVYSYLPFMILPLYASLSKLDGVLLEAAADLGARPASAFWRITLPLSLPGVFAGCLLVFIPMVGEYVIPALLGGAETLMIGRVLWDEFFSNRDWPLASAVAVVMLLILVVPLVLLQRQAERRAETLG